MEPLFVKEHIQTMKPYIQKTVDDLLAAMVEKGCSEPVDLIDKFALPVPSYVSFYTKFLLGWRKEKQGYLHSSLQIIYTILGVPFEDLEYLTQQNAIRSNGSATAQEASAANQ